MSSNPIKRMFDLYTSDMSIKEIQKLLKRESSEVYTYFAKDLPQPDQNVPKFTRILIFLRNLFNAFIMKLSPARRFFYLVAVFLFIVGYFQPNDLYLLLGFLTVNGLIVFELFDKLTLVDEITLAQKLQKNLIPQNPPDNKYYEISTYYEGAKEISGDYYDFIPSTKSDKIYLVIGDISGKGIAAALYMVRVQAILRTLVKYFDDIKELMSNLKENFMEKLEPGYFLTLILASINGNGNVSIARAGHNPAIFYSKKEDKFEEINSKGLGIGLKDNGMFEKILEERELITDEGDIIFFYTDGLSESMNKYKEQFGIEKVKNIIKTYSDRSADEIVKIIRDSIVFFRDETLIHDDLTMFLIKRKGHSA